MVTREDFESAREDLLARREALMHRADELREQFTESVDSDAVTMATGLALFSGGVAWALTAGLRGRRGMGSFAMPALLILVGSVLAGRGAASRRGVHIVETEQRVRDELAGLDPLARMRVLRDMAGEQLAFVRHASN